MCKKEKKKAICIYSDRCLVDAEYWEAHKQFKAYDIFLPEEVEKSLNEIGQQVKEILELYPHLELEVVKRVVGKMELFYDETNGKILYTAKGTKPEQVKNDCSDKLYCDADIRLIPARLKTFDKTSNGLQTIEKFFEVTDYKTTDEAVTQLEETIKELEETNTELYYRISRVAPDLDVDMFKMTNSVEFDEKHFMEKRKQMSYHQFNVYWLKKLLENAKEKLPLDKTAQQLLDESGIDVKKVVESKEKCSGCTDCKCGDRSE